MHGCDSGPAVIVNAEVDSMGGVDGGVGTGLKTSPRRAAIEKAQAELRQEYDVREERRRELEFLEKGGNPLDFRFGNAASLSVQSTSLVDRQAERILASEAKGSFALTTSTHGDSVESSGRPGVSESCEPNIADNLLLLNGENESCDGERNTKRPGKRNTVVLSEQYLKVDTTRNVKETEDSATVRPYARRNRSKINRDVTRSNPADLVHDRGSLPARGYSKDSKGSVFERKNQKVKDVFSMPNSMSATPNGDVTKTVPSVNQLNKGLVGLRGIESAKDLPEVEVSKAMMDTDASKKLSDNKHFEPLQVPCQNPTTDFPSENLDVVERRELAVSFGLGCPCEVEKKVVVEINSDQVEDFSTISSRDIKHVQAEQVSSGVITRKQFDSDPSCGQKIHSLEANLGHELCANLTHRSSNILLVGQTSKLEGVPIIVGDPMVKEKSEVNASEEHAESVDNDEYAPGKSSAADSISKLDEGKRTEVQGESIQVPASIGAQVLVASEAEGRNGVSEVVQKDTGTCIISSKKNSLTDRPLARIDVHACELPETTMSAEDTSVFSVQSVSGNLINKVHEESVLEEARIIQAKRKRIADLSAATVPVEICQRTHWDFVLEEMVWLANDFSQERLWKRTAAAQICRRVALVSWMKYEEQSQRLKARKVACTLAIAVMEFWHSVEVLVKGHSNDVDSINGRGLVDSTMAGMSEDPQESVVQQHFGKSVGLALQGYAIRYLKQNNFSCKSFQAEAPVTPERTSDCGTMGSYWDEQLTEESLFYAVPPGAAESYRTSIESCLEQSEKTGSSVQEEVDTSVLDAAADFMYHNDVYDEDDGETSTYNFPGPFRRIKSLKFNQKKRKDFMKSTAAQPYEMGPEFAYGNCTMETQQVTSMGKRPAHINICSIPTKRVRTGSRQRILSTFGSTATAGGYTAKTDASSGDTNSLQDDQSTLNGGSIIQKSLEVESYGEFEKQYDYAETLERPRKKKKARLLGSAYDQGWKLESAAHGEQRDHIRKRLESHHFDSNGMNGLVGQQNAKRPKMMKQQLDNAIDFLPNGSVPSPVASQMSNMSNPNKVNKNPGGRDRGRKSKASKITAGLPGSGCPWSLFEDQALVVLVHDMGPNWEFVSDAINSALQFKCVFRKPNECKERHRILMDHSGDGADSADDSGSSQSYTLPGIPKGSARQLFQRLQGPMEEDTLKSHFDKIIMIGKKQLYRRNQENNLEQRQIAPVHSSHGIALKQACPNSIKDLFLTPLDLCDVTPSSQDVLPYQASHTAGSGLSNQGALALNLSASAVSPSLQGSSVVVGGGHMPSPTAPLATSARDGRFGFPRTPIGGDEQQRTQQYNHVLPGRNIQQSNLSVPGAVANVDRAARMLTGGNAMGVICGPSRSIPLSRPGFPGISSSSMLNSVNMLSPSIMGMSNPVNMPSGSGSSQGNSTLRPRDGMSMIRPGQNPEHQRQLMAPELQMQVSQGSSPGIPAFNGLSSAFPSQTSSSPVQTYPGQPPQQPQISPQHSNAVGNSHQAHHQVPNHASGPQQQAYAIRVAKERQLQQQRLMQKQQVPQKHQQLTAGGALAPHVHQQAQLLMSDSMQSSSEIHSQKSLSPLGSSSPMTPMSLPQHQKHHLSSYGVNRNAQSGVTGFNNQMGKQRQRQQQLQQSGRQHPQHRQQTPFQQAKTLKGMGRGNMLVHNNRPVDPSQLNGISVVPGNHGAEKGEQIMHLMQGQGIYTGSGICAAQPSKPLVSPRSSNQSESQRKLSGSMPIAAKQLQPIPHSDNAGQGQAPLMPQAVLPAVIAPNHQLLPVQSQLNQKQVNQNQTDIHRILQQNCQSSSDSLSKSHAEQSKSDQLCVNSVSKMDSSTTMVMTQTCYDSTDTEHVVSSPAALRNTSEPMYSTGSPQLESSGSISITKSTMDAVPSVSRGLDQGELSGGLEPQCQGAGAHWQQQQPESQQASMPQLESQKSYKQHEQLQHNQNQLLEEQPPLEKISPQVHLQTAHGVSSDANLE